MWFGDCTAAYNAWLLWDGFLHGGGGRWLLPTHTRTKHNNTKTKGVSTWLCVTSLGGSSGVQGLGRATVVANAVGPHLRLLEPFLQPLLTLPSQPRSQSKHLE